MFICYFYLPFWSQTANSIKLLQCCLPSVAVVVEFEVICQTRGRVSHLISKHWELAEKTRFAEVFLTNSEVFGNHFSSWIINDFENCAAKIGNLNAVTPNSSEYGEISWISLRKLRKDEINSTLNLIGNIRISFIHSKLQQRFLFPLLD